MPCIQDVDLFLLFDYRKWKGNSDFDLHFRPPECDSIVRDVGIIDTLSTSFVCTQWIMLQFAPHPLHVQTLEVSLDCQDRRFTSRLLNINLDVNVFFQTSNQTRNHNCPPPTNHTTAELKVQDLLAHPLKKNQHLESAWLDYHPISSLERLLRQLSKGEHRPECSVEAAACSEAVVLLPILWKPILKSRAHFEWGEVLLEHWGPAFEMVIDHTFIQDLQN